MPIAVAENGRAKRPPTWVRLMRGEAHEEGGKRLGGAMDFTIEGIILLRGGGRGGIPTTPDKGNVREKRGALLV